MSKGQEAIALLQRYFGERVDPAPALGLMFAKLDQQNAIIGMLKNLACAMAFDHGTIVGTAEWCGRAQQAGDDEALHALLALPCVELRAETVEPTQQPPGRVRLA